MVGFIFGSKDKDKPWTYEELQRKREIAETLAAGNLRTPQNVGEGLASIGRALMYRKLDKKAGAEEARLKNEFDQKWGSVFGGYGGAPSGGGASYAASGGQGGGRGSPSGTWTPDAPAPDAVDMATQGLDVAKKGGLGFGAGTPKADPGVTGAGQEPLDFGAAVMTPQQMLIEGAKRRGLDPIDVATAISYETGGKFDPTIKGPTTQWGTHEGLIQFGDPQGEKYGADFSNPDAAWRSQLNPDSGAVWRYLEDTGVKSGMGLPEIYSAINAGSVGRMGASDANNGGAPGTVADKVASMGPHREKAAQFLGGTWTPADGSPATSGGGNQGIAFADASGGFPAGMDIGALVGLASDPMASPAQKAIIETLIQQQMQAADPVRALQMEKAQLELEALKNPKPGFTAIPPLEAQQLGLPEGGVYQRGPNGEIEVVIDPPKGPEPGFTQLTPEEVQALGLPPGVYQKGADGKITAVGGGGTSVTVNNGNGELPGLSKLGEGYTYIYNPDGTIKLDPQGLPMSAPIPGGPADAKAQDAAAEAAALEAKNKNKTTQGKLKLGATLENLNLNIAEIENGGLPVTGAVGDARRTWLGRLITGDSAMDFGNRNNQITDSAALAEVQNMRDNSPTGGAVGSLTDDERRAIGNAVTAMNTSTSPEEYVRAAKAYRELAMNIAYGEGTWELDENGQPQIKGAATPRPRGNTGTTKSGLKWSIEP